MSKKRKSAPPSMAAHFVAGHINARSRADDNALRKKVKSIQWGVEWSHELLVILSIRKLNKKNALPGGACRLQALFLVASLVMEARVDDEDLDQIAEAACDPSRGRAKGVSAMMQLQQDKANHKLLTKHHFFDTLALHLANHSETSYWAQRGGPGLLRCSYRVASAYLRLKSAAAYHHPACEFGLYASFIAFYGRGSSLDEKVLIKEWLDIQRAAIKEFHRRCTDGENFFPYGPGARGRIHLQELGRVEEHYFES